MLASAVRQSETLTAKCDSRLLGFFFLDHIWIILINNRNHEASLKHTPKLARRKATSCPHALYANTRSGQIGSQSLRPGVDIQIQGVKEAGCFPHTDLEVLL